MNKTVTLVNEWAAYEAQYPEAELEDFCRYFLTARKTARSASPVDDRAQPPTPRSVLMRIIGRITAILAAYSKKALQGAQMNNPEAFSLLNSAWQLGGTSKTEIINQNLVEFSTGIDMLNRMRRDGLISEQPDPDDGRSKLIRITPTGQEALFDMFNRFQQVGSLVLKDLPEEDVLLCIQLLKGVESKHWKICAETKNDTFEEIMKAHGPGVD